MTRSARRDERTRQRSSRSSLGLSHLFGGLTLRSKKRAPAHVVQDARRILAINTWANQQREEDRHNDNAFEWRNKDKRTGLEARFLSSGHGFSRLGAGWRGVCLLGQGGQGRAGLWAQVGPNQDIVDRMVVKESETSLRFWHNPANWKDGILHGVPIEAYHNKLVNTLQNDSWDTSNTVTMHGSRVYKESHSYRLYMSFCSQGSLFDMRSAQLSPRTRTVHCGSRIVTGPREPAQLPEPVIWYLLWNLVIAAAYMENPPGLKDGPENSNIIHLDLKPHNIFLNDPQESFFPRYPAAVIGDFGSSVLTHPKDLGNPSELLHQPATPGYKPPEYEGGGTGEQLGPWTNVYQLGMVMYVIMKGGHDSLEQIEFRNEHAEKYPPGLDELSSRYSSDLVDLVKDCLNPDTTLRPRPIPLFNRIGRLLPEHVHGMDTDEALKVDPASDMLLNLDRRNTYAVGMTLEPHQIDVSHAWTEGDSISDPAAGGFMVDCQDEVRWTLPAPDRKSGIDVARRDLGHASWMVDAQGVRVAYTESNTCSSGGIGASW